MGEYAIILSIMIIVLVGLSLSRRKEVKIMSALPAVLEPSVIKKNEPYSFTIKLNKDSDSIYDKYINVFKKGNFPCTLTTILSVWLSKEENEFIVVVKDFNIEIMNELRDEATKLWGTYSIDVGILFLSQSEINLNKIPKHYEEVYRNA